MRDFDDQVFENIFNKGCPRIKLCFKIMGFSIVEFSVFGVCWYMLRVLVWYFLLYERPKEWELIPESVRKSVHMKITLGVLCIILPVRRIVANCWKYGYFSKHHECSHDLWAHNLIRECFGYCLLAFLQHVFVERATEGVRAYPWIWSKYVWVRKSVSP